MIHLTSKEVSGNLNLINEAVAATESVASDSNETFKQRLKIIATQTEFDEGYACAFVTITRNFMVYQLNCFYCDACYMLQDWAAFTDHVDKRHCANEQTHMQRFDDDFEAEQTEAIIVTPQGIDGFSEDNDAELAGPCFGVEVHSDELVSESNDEVRSIDEFLVTKPESQWETDNNMLQSGNESNHQFHIESSDASLVFFIIDLLQSYPTLWFINGPKSKQYEAGLTSLAAKFAEKYPFFMTTQQLHESLIEIRDWYQRIFQQKKAATLPFPECEYYGKLAEFLPDNLNGKTCELCERLLQDHVQYFAHKKVEHGKTLDGESSDGYDEQSAAVSLAFLKQHINYYLSARYPRYEPNFSYRCQICAKKYELKSYFIEHIKTHLDISDYVCDICDKTFIRLENYLLHKKRHETKCQTCGKEFNNFSLLNAHRKRKHIVFENTIEGVALPLQYTKRDYIPSAVYVAYTERNRTHYACLFCEKTYRHKSGVLKHNSLMHKIKPSSLEKL